jgi:hypothetical protein
LKRERVTNFLGVPGAIEKVIKLQHWLIAELDMIVDGIWNIRMLWFFLIYLYYTSFTILLGLLSFYHLYHSQHKSIYSRTKRKVNSESIVCLC